MSPRSSGVPEGDDDHGDYLDASSGSRRRAVLSGVGWATVAVMGVVVVALTTVLAGMLLVVSVWLTVTLPVVVLAALVAVAAYARRA